MNYVRVKLLLFLRCSVHFLRRYCCGRSGPNKQSTTDAKANVFQCKNADKQILYRNSSVLFCFIIFECSRKKLVVLLIKNSQTGGMSTVIHFSDVEVGRQTTNVN